MISGKPEVIANNQGNRTTPSVVAFTETERLVGEGAEIQRKLDPHNAVFDAKRFIGRTFDDPVVQEHMLEFPFKMIDNKNKINFQVEFRHENINVAPEEIAAALLEKMKRTAEEYLEEPVKEAVITVPAYFTDSQRKATENAGRIAGLDVLRVLNEPTAAAMAYGLAKKTEIGIKEDDSKTVLVYDMGGGTFDVSLLEIDGEGTVEVKATSGNTFLGGEDFTRKIFQHFKKEMIRKYQFDISLQPGKCTRLTIACENMKRKLSAANVEMAELKLESLLPDGQDFESSISRAKFENLCKPLIDSSVTTVKKVLSDAKMNKHDVDEIVLVGGSTRIPKIQEILRNFFLKNPNKSINPDEAVACGAAIQAAILNNVDSSVEDMLLLDITPLSLGLNMIGGITKVVVERNSLIPLQKTQDVATAANNQTVVCFEIVEGILVYFLVLLVRLKLFFR